MSYFLVNYIGHSKITINEKRKIYKVTPYGKESPMYQMTLDVSNNKAICTCHKFEFMGILCRHVFVVFVKKSLVSSLT